jgi:hypothetical protein
MWLTEGTAMRGRHRGLSGLLAASLLTPPAGMILAEPAMAQRVDQFGAAIASLAAQVRAEVTRLPATSTVEAYEGPLLFLADQSGQPDTVVCAAFDQVKQESTTPANARIAMTNICRMLRFRRGTGAFGNSGNSVGSSAFSAPVVSLGGGSSNYTPR